MKTVMQSEVKRAKQTHRREVEGGVSGMLQQSTTAVWRLILIRAAAPQLAQASALACTLQQLLHLSCWAPELSFGRAQLCADRSRQHATTIFCWLSFAMRCCCCCGRENRKPHKSELRAMCRAEKSSDTRSDLANTQVSYAQQSGRVARNNEFLSNSSSYVQRQLARKINKYPYTYTYAQANSSFSPPICFVVIFFLLRIQNSLRNIQVAVGLNKIYYFFFF